MHSNIEIQNFYAVMKKAIDQFYPKINCFCV